MKNLCLAFTFFFIIIGNAQNEILFFQTNWGYNGGIEDFMKKQKNPDMMELKFGYLLSLKNRI